MQCQVINCCFSKIGETACPSQPLLCLLFCSKRCPACVIWVLQDVVGQRIAEEHFTEEDNTAVTHVQKQQRSSLSNTWKSRWNLPCTLPVRHWFGIQCKYRYHEQTEDSRCAGTLPCDTSQIRGFRSLTRHGRSVLGSSMFCKSPHSMRSVLGVFTCVIYSVCV